MLGYIILIIYVFAGSIGMVLIRKGGLESIASIEKGKISISVSWIFVVGLILYFISFFFWIYILQLFPLTYISPVVYGIVYILMAILSNRILNEPINIFTLIGSALIISGVVIASINR